MADAPPGAGQDRASRSSSGVADHPANDHPAAERSAAAAAPHRARVVDAGSFTHVLGGFEGVGVRAASRDGDFDLVLVHADRARSVVVGTFDGLDVVAVWRSFGAASGLPLVLPREDGSLERPYPQLGRLLLGAIRIRRRHALIADRRPRFLSRRKTARLPDRPVVWREKGASGEWGAVSGE